MPLQLDFILRIAGLVRFIPLQKRTSLRRCPGPELKYLKPFAPVFMWH